VIEALPPRPSLIAENGGSNLPGRMLPGEILLLKGCGIGPDLLTQYQIASDGRISNQLAGTAVSFDGLSAPVIYASNQQVATIVPYSVPADSALVSVAYGGRLATSTTVLSQYGPLYLELCTRGISSEAVFFFPLRNVICLWRGRACPTIKALAITEGRPRVD
jgi:uncharacterized protein (TIGR03437 family)